MENENKKKEEFSLAEFINKVSQINTENTIPENIYKSCLRIYEIYFCGNVEGLPEDYCIYDEFSREEIEWFADALINWPYNDGELDSEIVLSHPMIQNLVIKDILKNLSHTKREKKKGFVFI